MRDLGWIVTLFCAASASALPCPNPYFPLEEGLSLKYRAGNNEVALSFSGVTATSDGQKADLEIRVKGKSGRTEAVCTPDGGMAGRGGLEGAAIQSTGMDVEVVASEGVVVPPAEKLVEGHTWTSKIALEMRPPAKTKLPFRPVIRTTFTRKCTVMGADTVKVAGGSFQAMKVKVLTTAVGGAGGVARTIESLMWLAPDVGIVKISTGNATNLELLEILKKP